VSAPLTPPALASERAEPGAGTGLAQDGPAAPVAAEPITPGAERPAEPARVSGLDRLTSLFEVVLCSGFPTQLFLTLVLYVSGLSPVRPGGGLSLPFVVALSLADTVLLTALVVLLLRARRESPSRVLLGQRRVARETAIGLLLVPAVLGAAAGLGWAFEHYAPWLHNVPENPLAGLMRTPMDFVVVGAVAVIAGGLREELQRAFVLHRFDQHLGGGMIGLLVFSVVFGAGHFVQGYDVMIITGLLGMAWGALYLWRRSMVAPLVCHAAFNLVEVAVFGAMQ
jgi:membrane protease YdiL (CAAX protease family)